MNAFIGNGAFCPLINFFYLSITSVPIFVDSEYLNILNKEKKKRDNVSSIDL